MSYLFSLFLTLIALSASAQTNLTIQPCKLEGVDEARCGKLMVFENREKQAGRKIPIAFVVLPALMKSSEKEEPLFELAGTSFAELYADLKIFRQHHDIVLVDQRGTGQSYPLNCLSGKKTPQDFLDNSYSSKAVKNCAELLQKIADLNAYSTSIAMDDLDDIRKALGYSKIHLIGSSYYSRVAQEYIRRHGEHVASAVLMHAVPTSMTLPSRHATYAQRALEMLWKDCATDALCARAFPNLKSEWHNLLQRLEHQPVRVKYENRDLQIRSEVFAEFVRTQLYSPATIRKLPYLIHQAAAGNFAPYLSAAIPKELRDDPDNNDGWYFSMVCSENAPFIDLNQARTLNLKTDFGNYRVEQQQQSCQNWPVRPVAKTSLNPVVSDVPVLLISGGKDPVTPPEVAVELMRTFRDSKHVVVREGGHVFSGLTHSECVDEIIADFLDASKVSDPSCVESMLPPAFQIQ